MVYWLIFSSLMVPSRHPTYSLLWFLLASNSLDLIIDLALELWSAIFGTL